jgi:hypothetical protein
VETLRFFVFQSRFARPHDPLYRDLL